LSVISPVSEPEKKAESMIKKNSALNSALRGMSSKEV